MKVSEAIVEKAILSLPEIQAVKRVLESLRSPQKEPLWNVFDMKSTGPSNICCDICDICASSPYPLSGSRSGNFNNSVLVVSVARTRNFKLRAASPELDGRNLRARQ